MADAAAPASDHGRVPSQGWRRAHPRALEGLFLEGYVFGTLTFGYAGEPVPGKFTKRRRPRCRIVINPDEAKIVVSIFEWWVAGDSINAIVRKLNAIPGVPLPRNRLALVGPTIRSGQSCCGPLTWALELFGDGEDVSSPQRIIPGSFHESSPSGQETFENLRIISDQLWFAAQNRLAKNKAVRGRKSDKEDADPSLRIMSGLFYCPDHDRPLRACSAFGRYLGCPTCATLTEEMRPLFSKPNRKVVLRLLCEKLAKLIRQDTDLVDKTIAECRAQAAAIQRPDGSEIERLEKAVASVKRKIDFNMRNPGETEEDEKEIADTLRSLRRERQSLQDQLGLIKAAAAEPVRVPTIEEVNSLLDRFSDILQGAAAGQLGGDQDTARDILETLTGGRIDMFQQGERENMQGWLQGRFTIRLLDVLVEKFTGTSPVKDGEEVEIVIDFKRPRKMDADADEAIQLWLNGDMQKEIAPKLRSSQGYVSRLLRIGAARMGTTLEACEANARRGPSTLVVCRAIKKLPTR